MTHNIYLLKMDGKKVFCIESGIPANSGEGYTSDAYILYFRRKKAKSEIKETSYARISHEQRLPLAFFYPQIHEKVENLCILSVPRQL